MAGTDAASWLQRWQERRIGFHEAEANAMLVAWFPALALPRRSRVFVPLCGKSRDIAWLLSQGHRVVGVELSELAIRALFEELGILPEVSTAGDLLRFSAPDLDVFVGDLFALSGEVMGAVDAIYDRAALVALATEMRSRYAKHLIAVTNAAPQLLVCFEYDQTLLEGPPFSVDAQEVNRLYAARYAIRPLASVALKNGLKGKYPAQESAWLLR